MLVPNGVVAARSVERMLKRRVARQKTTTDNSLARHRGVNGRIIMYELAIQCIGVRERTSQLILLGGTL
jgi:hypothetical protein